LILAHYLVPGSDLVLLGQVSRQPIQAFVQPLRAGGARALDVPVALPDGVQAQLVRQFCRRHGIGQILQGRKGSFTSIKEAFEVKLTEFLENSSGQLEIAMLKDMKAMEQVFDGTGHRRLLSKASKRDCGDPVSSRLEMKGLETIEQI
jgi:hypothetical protein